MLFAFNASDVNALQPAWKALHSHPGLQTFSSTPSINKTGCAVSQVQPPTLPGSGKHCPGLGLFELFPNDSLMFTNTLRLGIKKEGTVSSR